MFPLENEYKSLLPRNAHGTYKAACTTSCDMGMKVSTNGLCHMTKLAGMSIYGKKIKKSSSLEPKGR